MNLTDTIKLDKKDDYISYEMISIVNVRKVRTETSLERVARIELARPGRKHGILPLNYTRILQYLI